MIKLILLVRRKSGMDRAQFKEYYESTHAPLAASLMPHCTKYVRNFVDEEVSGPLGFDVVTEFWFGLPGPWAEVQKLLGDEAVRARLEQDELNCMDRPAMQFFVAEERTTDPGLLLGNKR
jgi:uncharacterized protein (TIGR02118 family)